MSTISNIHRSSVLDIAVTSQGWDSSPVITRSTVTGSSFKDSSSSTRIHRSIIKQVTMESASKSQGAKDEDRISTPGGNGNTITRCNLRNCNITNAWVKRCTFENCELLDVPTARWVQGRHSQFLDVASVKRSDFTDSVVRDGSSVRRSTVNKSVVREASSLKRSNVTGTTVSQSQISRTTLQDCDITECVVSRSEFKGMILKNGIWKRGILVGRLGDKEPVMIRKDGLEAGHYGLAAAARELDSKSQISTSGNPPAHHVDSDVSIRSDSDDSDDLPPPYKA